MEPSRSELFVAVHFERGALALDPAVTDGIAIRPESQNCTRQELERRREIVRQFFNDFWRSADDEPVTFAERLIDAQVLAGWANLLS